MMNSVRKRSGSIAFRLSLWFLLLSIIPLAVLAVYVRYTILDLLVRQAGNYQLSQTEFFVAQIARWNDATIFVSNVDAGYTLLLVDRDGAYLTHPDPHRVGEKIGADLPQVDLEDALSGATGQVITDKWIITFASIPGRDWIGVGMGSKEAVFGILRQFELIAFGQLAASMVVVALTGGVVIWLVVGRPLRDLAKVASQIGQSTDDIFVETEDYDDELEILASALNDSHVRIRSFNDELEQRVTERTAQLEAANKELEAFSYSVSHDLRAPLRALDGYSRLLLDDYAGQLPGEGRYFAKMIRESAQQMGRLIDDLLSFSRLNRQPMSTQVVNPHHLIQQAFETLKDELYGRSIEIVIDELADCEGDPALLRQVWVNLLSNAVKFTCRRPHGRVEVGYFHQDSEDVYFVKDNGAGFDMKYYDKLFGVFQRLHRPDEYEGTGVGLAIVYRIIQRHNGRIWAEAAVDQGATFYFTLPSS